VAALLVVLTLVGLAAVGGQAGGKGGAHGPIVSWTG
jgi:hypothetical protein